MSGIKVLVAIAVVVLLLCATPIAAQVHATLRLDPTVLQGTHPTGDLMLYSPEPVQSGSSLSHWDTSATPNLLMEPFASDAFTLDITPFQMADIGWTVDLTPPLDGGTATFNVFPLDPPGTGFEDPRPFPGAPGNPAATLGEARVNLFNSILGTWGTQLMSDVPVDVLVTWTPQFCDPNFGATLAAAGTTFVFADAPGGAFAVAETWHHAALAEAIVGVDLTGPPEEGGGDIIVFMNSLIDDECLAPGTGYYYGTDNNPPPNQIDVASVVLHELGHGLGFANFTNEAAGTLFSGLPGIFDVFTQDVDQNRTWNQMTDAQRRASAENFRGITWIGPNVRGAVADFVDPGTPHLEINAPFSLAGAYPVGQATFGPPLDETGVSGNVACMYDGTSVGEVLDLSPLNGCGPATNPDDLAGNIALIDRGDCAFVQKVANAEAAGAIAAIIVDNAGSTGVGLGGDGPSITIPSVRVGRSDGNTIRQVACGTSAGFANNDRFKVTATWGTATDSGPAQMWPLTTLATWGSFFNPQNPEITAKVLNGCAMNGHYWFFGAAMTNVEHLVTVTDTRTGQVAAYYNPLGNPAPPIQDTTAFATCP